MTFPQEERHGRRPRFLKKDNLPPLRALGRVSTTAPPGSIRYCDTCRKMTPWLYERKYQHSRCQNCGGEHSRREAPK